MQNTSANKNSTRSWLQSALRVLVPKDDRFYDMLEEQAQIGFDAAVKLTKLSSGDFAKIVAEIQDLEHQGDRIEHRMEEALASTFVTPLDREDIQKLSSEFDDVTDRINKVAVSCQMRGVNKLTPPMVEMTKLLHRMSGLLVNAMCKLRGHNYASVTELARKVRDLESDGDRVYRAAITALNEDDGIDAKRLRREEKVLEDLEKALNTAEDLADCLINLAVKHG